MDSAEKVMSQMTWLDKSKVALDRYIELSQQLLDRNCYCEETERKRLAAFHNFNCYSLKAKQADPAAERDAGFLDRMRQASELNLKVLDLWQHFAELYRAESIQQNRTLQVVQRYQLRKPLLQRFRHKL